jgi:hypothetical protein
MVQVSSLPIPPNDQCKSFPIAIAVGDVDQDTLDDVVVEDPSCGNWIAKATGPSEFAYEGWISHFPSLRTRPFLTFYSTSLLISSNEVELDVVHRDGSWQQTGKSLLGPFMNPLMTTSMFAVNLSDSMSPTILFQGGTFLSKIIPHSADGQFDLPDPEIIHQVQPSSLKPFYGYDHLVSPTETSCDFLGLGIGLYQPEAGKVPRRVSVLRPAGAGTYLAEDLPFQCNVATFGILERPNKSDMIVAALGTCGSDTTIELLQIADCASKRYLSRDTIDFPMHVVSAPGEIITDALQGVQLFVDSANGLGIRLSNYDGFSVRTWTASDGGWALHAQSTTVHDVREDVVW